MKSVRTEFSNVRRCVIVGELAGLFLHGDVYLAFCSRRKNQVQRYTGSNHIGTN